MESARCLSGADIKALEAVRELQLSVENEHHLCWSSAAPGAGAMKKLWVISLCFVLLACGECTLQGR